MYFVLKWALSGLIVAAVSELGRRYSLLGATLASLPLTSILAIIWLYRETESRDKVVALSSSIGWIVLPSLVFFFLLSSLLGKSSLSFWASLALSCMGMVVTYAGYVWVVRRLGIEL